MLLPRERTQTRYGRWEYCYDTEERRHVYLHVDCDAVSHNGRCVLCGAPDPCSQTLEPARR